mmetsp:Transcript_20353/g.42724  ORF Transcript_20353/g.42724 Transcript_20353/m.42724 type:complete len:110 (-) Transcript_20353:95-424(-)
MNSGHQVDLGRHCHGPTTTERDLSSSLLWIHDDGSAFFGTVVVVGSKRIRRKIDTSKSSRGIFEDASSWSDFQPPMVASWLVLAPFSVLADMLYLFPAVLFGLVDLLLF